MRRVYAVSLVALLLALIAFFPLGLALQIAGLDGRLFAARSVEGSVWNGTLRDVSIDGVPLGDFASSLSPIRLLTGVAAIRLQGAQGGPTAVATSSLSALGVEALSASFANRSAFAPLPVERVELKNAAASFRNGQCVSASGLVRVQLASELAGVPLGQTLTGTPRCDGPILSVPLVSQSQMERVLLRLSPDGQYEAKLLMKAQDAATAVKLTAMGLPETQQGHVMTLAGRF